MTLTLNLDWLEGMRFSYNETLASVTLAGSLSVKS